MIDQAKLAAVLANTGDMCLKRRAKEIVLNLNPRPQDTILDAGCGDGFYLHLLSQLSSSQLIGLDDNPKALDLARHYVKSPRLKLVEADVTHMPFKTGTFHKIICSEVLEHLPDDVLGLKEFKRVLKPRGLVAITVPSHNYPFLWDPVNWLLEHILGVHFKDGFWAGVWNQHLRLYTPQTLTTMIQKSGLKLVTLKCLTHYGLPFNHFLLNIGYRLRRSSVLPQKSTISLNKFSSHQSKGLYQYLLNIVNRIDRLNDRDFSQDTPTVGLFALAQKA